FHIPQVDLAEVRNEPSADNRAMLMTKDPFRWNICCQGNAMMGLYDAWDHIVDYKGSFAQVNLLLNRASQYLDIKSELPYRGAVHLFTKPNLGLLENVGVRIPNWVDRKSVTLRING